MFYYKCENCQSEWNGIKMLEGCPFCDTKVAIQTSNFTKIDEVLSYVFSVYGIEVVKEHNKLVSLLSDYAPTLERERKLIRIALSSGVYSDLMTVSKNDKSAQELSVNKSISKLHNDAFMDPNIAKEIIDWFVTQLGWEERKIQQETVIASVTKSTNVAFQMPSQTVGTVTAGVSYKVGDIVRFGKYPFESNGWVRPITWQIMDIKGSKALLWSEYCIDASLFSGQNLNCSWEYSGLRQWIRSIFTREAFSTDELNAIYLTNVETSYNTKTNRSSGSTTLDKIFIPSNEEINYYKLRNGDLIVKATPYAKIKGVFNDNDCAFWWLRTPGTAEGTEMLVSKTGVVNESGSFVYLKNRGVRPALWVNLDKIKK